MLAWLSQFLPEWVAQFVISLWAALVGTAMRLAHVAAREREQITWKRFGLELPTVFGMAIIAGPVGRFLHTEYRVDLEIVYALCVVLGYLGANAINRFAVWLEKKGTSDVSDD